MTHRANTPRVLVLTAVATLAGCVLLDRMRPREEVFAFPHAMHVEDLDCSDCHAGVEDSDEPGFPAKGQCMLCHESMEEDAPPERKIEQLFDGDTLRLTSRPELSGEVIFSHELHANGEEDCSACHVGIEDNLYVGDLPSVSMAACMACHEQNAVSNECATCHSQIGTDWAPPSHAQSWTKRHGQVFRAGSAELVDDCGMCHKEDTCNACHQEVAPENHTNFWRRRGHLVSARMDRANCTACHREDFCSRCHAETLPLSHTGSFGGTTSTHCLTCHFPLASQGCITCHKSTPSHLNATPLPAVPPHSPALNCRQCHGLSAPLPHVDKGDECILCHR